MKNCKWDTRGNLVSYERDNGDIITDYKQLSKSMGLDNKSSSSYSESSVGYSTNEGTPGLRVISVSLMLLASLVVIFILWRIAFTSKSNLFMLTILLTFGILGWDAFIIFIEADDFAYVLGERQKQKEMRRKIHDDSHLNSLGRCDCGEDDII